MHGGRGQPGQRHTAKTTLSTRVYGNTEGQLTPSELDKKRPEEAMQNLSIRVPKAFEEGRQAARDPLADPLTR